MHARHRSSGSALILAFLAVALAASAARAAGEEDGQNAHPGILTVGGFYLFYNEQAPLSFVTMVPHEAPQDRVELGEVSGRSCQHGASVPTSLSLNATSISAAAGNGGYFKALDNIRKAHANLAGIYDVRADLRTFSILRGVYQRLCVEVVARGFALK